MGTKYITSPRSRHGSKKFTLWSRRQKTHKESQWRKGSGTKTPRYDRVDILRGLFVIGVGIIIVRLFILMILQHGFYEALASGQHELYQKLMPQRGNIYVQDPKSDNHLYVIADNQTLTMVYAVPRDITDPKKAAEGIAPLLNLDVQTLYDRLNKKDDLYEPIARKVSNAQVDALKKLEIKGIRYTDEQWRFYPEKNYTSHITGFVGIGQNDGDEPIGQYGLEQYYNTELKGTQGFLHTERDGAGRWITVGDRLLEEAQDGYDVVLTIDKNIQFNACKRLQDSVMSHGAKKGSLIIMNPKTGAVLAMCNYPDFDANAYNEVEDIEVYTNSAVSEEWEPGSVFKTFTLGAAIDQGKIGPETIYHDTGSVQVANYTIRNSDKRTQNRDVNMSFVLEQSLNTGSIFAVQQIGNEAWYDYVKKFGFGEATGIELAGENAGSIVNLTEMKDIYSATSSFGQGIRVTPIQLASAFGAIANNGKLMKPHIVDKIILDNGFEEKTSPEEVRQVVSQSTAQTLSAMLVNVIDAETGHARRAAVSGYFFAGKTGTAQIAKSDGVGYDGARHNDTFVGFGPISDPQFVMLTKINEPQDVMWSEGSATPLFGEIAAWLVNYLEIPPDRPEN